MLISFDLDGVLMENPFSSGVFPRVLDAFVAALPRNMTEAERRETAWKRIRDTHRERFVGPSPYTAYDWDGVICAVAEEMGLSLELNIVDLVKSYAVPPHIKAHVGAEDILRYLRDKGYIVVAVTNGYYCYQYPVLQALGLDSFFHRLITPDQVRSIKPERAIFQEVQKQAPGKPWYHVGDSLIQDIGGGAMAGAMTVWVPRNREALAEKEVAPTMASSLFQEALKQQLKKEKELFSLQGIEEEALKPHHVMLFLRQLKDIV